MKPNPAVLAYLRQLVASTTEESVRYAEAAEDYRASGQTELADSCAKVVAANSILVHSIASVLASVQSAPKSR